MESKYCRTSNVTLVVFGVAACLLLASGVTYSKVVRQVVLREPMGTGPAQIGIRAGQKLILTPPDPAKHGGVMPGGGGVDEVDTFPQALSVAPDGSIYIADHINLKVARFDKGGRFLSAFPFPPKVDQHSQGSYTVGALANDSSGNLYIASTFINSKGLYKYSPDGKLLQIFDFTGKEIFCNRIKGWVKDAAVQTSGLLIMMNGNIALRGSGELLLLNPAGEILQKWHLDTSSNYVSDRSARMYLVSPDKNVEVYDGDGKMIQVNKCGVAPSRIQDKRCKLPEWIDRKGNLYWRENDGIAKTDPSGKQIEKVGLTYMQLAQFGDRKFDHEGNLYYLDATDSDYIVEKISFQ